MRSMKNIKIFLICAVMSSVGTTLLGQQPQPHSFITEVGSLSPNCTGLASCGIMNCPELPYCTGECVGDFWRYCQRQGCYQDSPDTQGQIMTICAYNCTDTPLPFGYDLLKFIEKKEPHIISGASAVYGMLPVIINSAIKSPDSCVDRLPLKRLFGWGCVGLLWGANCMFMWNSTELEKVISAICVPFVLSAVTEYALNKVGR